MSKSGSRTEMRIAILGAGASGLCMAVKLKEAGYTQITIFEKSDGVGGTWRANTYPGCGCDVPSHLYSYSFDLNPNWNFKWSMQPQILQYFNDFADKYDVRKLCQFNTEIVDCKYDEAGALWTLTDATGAAKEFDLVVSGLGQLNIPHTPEFPGASDFKGASFHSAQWDHSVDLEGKTVCVVGNGPSAVQFIPPVQKMAGKLINFQRSPAWCRPRGQREYTASDKKSFASQRFRMNWYRWRIRAYADFGFGAFMQKSPMKMDKSMKDMCQKHFDDQISDPKIRELLQPDFEPGCKRILISDDYFPALCQPNVEIVREGVERITETGVIGTDGTERECDVIIFGTGFRSTEFLTPMEVTGRDNSRLNDVWHDGPSAYKGVAVSGFPNFFMLYGPNTNLGHNSIILMVEYQADYVVKCANKLSEVGVAAVDVTPKAMRDWNEKLQSNLDKTVWAGDCSSWYKTEGGKITNNWSGTTVEYGKEMKGPEWDAYQVFHTS